MKKLFYSLAAFALALGIIPMGSAVAATGQVAESSKPLQLAQFYHRGYWVCYTKVRVYGWKYRGGSHYYRRNLGVRYYCGIFRSPCRFYGKYQFGWYGYYGQARNAAYRCSRYWY